MTTTSSMQPACTNERPAPVTRALASVTVKQRIGRAIIPRLPFTRFLFDQLRTEVNAAAVSIKNVLLPRRRVIIHGLRRQTNVLVNVACGPRPLEGFVNLDLFPTAPGVITWDCRRSLPLSDGSSRGIRVEHFLEHLETREELSAFLDDCYRALQANGVLRIIVPDVGRYLRAYCEPDLSGFRDLHVPIPFPDDLPTRMDVVNHVFHQWHEHRWGYDFEALESRLTRAGFGQVTQLSFGKSLLPDLAHDLDMHAPYSLYVDAVKLAPTR